MSYSSKLIAFIFYLLRQGGKAKKAKRHALQSFYGFFEIFCYFCTVFAINAE